MADTSEEASKSGATEVTGLGISAEADGGELIVGGEAGSSNKFQQAVAAWRALDLTTLVARLDGAASELVEHQKDSLVQRKELAQKTKDFRKLDDAGKLGEIKEMLKAYQTYIDTITAHHKSVQAAFMQAYSPLSEAPDPYPLLEASIDALVTADEVLPKLQQEQTHLQAQVAALTSQLDDAEQQLQEERGRRESFAAAQDAKIKEVEDSWAAVLKEKEDNWAAKERGWEEKAEGQERLLKELKASYEVSQRLEKSGEEDAGRSVASQAELDIVTSELDRANVRLAELESRNEQLRLELAQSAGQAHSSGRSTAVEDDPAYLRLRTENQSLLRRWESARYDRESEKKAIEGRVRGLEREINALKADRDALRSKVHKWSDYDEVKRELDMLRAIEFSTLDEDDDADANAAGDKSSGESLEQLLLARNKKLSNELTELRVSHNDLQQRLETLQEDMSSTNMELEKVRNLNATLENDLQKTQQEASNAFETMSVAGTYTSRFPKSSYGSRRGGTSPTSSIIGGFDPSSNSPRTLESLRAGEPVGAGSGILPMVTAQRDRFKKKISELEAEMQKQFQIVSSLRSEVASLQKDNLNLYEKTRYVSTYSRSATSGARYGGNPTPSSIAMAETPSDRYRSAYEQNISPFAAFRGRESARAIKRMSLPERAVFQITRMVLATRTSRNLFAVYCLGLHLLIFVMLYWMGSTDIQNSASHLGAVTVAGGASVGGQRLPAGVAGVGGAGKGDASHGEWRQEGAFEGNG
ncbi:protein CASP-like [Teratosphaeria destructans]|uniref:Protein CASP n=1 Tax=Teratosphaeria destructans TaxID=418781 RepID=A0A9W7SLD3_9PEZI|nr:protein CASP-like [Teratosphaeria destructans]